MNNTQVIHNCPQIYILCQAKKFNEEWKMKNWDLQRHFAPAIVHSQFSINKGVSSRYPLNFTLLLTVAFIFIIHSRFHKTFEQRMGLVGAGLEFRVGLGGDEEGMLLQLDHFHQHAVR